MNATKPVSKVLLLESAPDPLGKLARFCNAHHLTGVEVPYGGLDAVLDSHIDLGAVLLAEDYGGSATASAAVAARLGTARPELPIILRRTSRDDNDTLPAALRELPRAWWTLDDPTLLRTAIEQFVFSHDYPDALVRGVAEITASRLASMFGEMDVTWDPPSIVRDRIIFGGVLSLIPLESTWCRGYMLIQAEDGPLLEMIGAQFGHDGTVTTDFRTINSLLGELTNLVWGALKNRYLGNAGTSMHAQVQVPLLINHRHRYISFGSDNPQLCFRYRLTERATGRTACVDQRLVFSLNWSPEAFAQADASGAAAADSDSGALELF